MHAQELVFLGGVASEEGAGEESSAWSLEDLGDHFALGLAWYDEDRFTGSHRDGPLLQLLGRAPPIDEQLVLGAGAGPHLALHGERSDDGGDFEEEDERLALMISMRASWRLGAHRAVPVTWNRVATNYDRDTDVLPVGLSDCF